MNKIKPYLLWISKILISALFILASIGKLMSSPAVIQMFNEWGYYDGFYLVIGIIELTLTILLLIPKTSRYAAIFLFLLMIGALITHLIHDPISATLRPVIFMLFIGLVIYSKRGKKALIHKND